MSDIKSESEKSEQMKQVSSDEESEKDDLPEKQKKLQSPFFKQVFTNSEDWRTRQTRCVMKQIGLKPNAKMSEVELEEYIIVKAITDFNTSKFAHDMLAQINGIISDVFLGSVPKRQPQGSDYSNLTELVFSGF